MEFFAGNDNTSCMDLQAVNQRDLMDWVTCFPAMTAFGELTLVGKGKESLQGVLGSFQIWALHHFLIHLQPKVECVQLQLMRFCALMGDMKQDVVQMSFVCSKPDQVKCNC